MGVDSFLRRSRLDPSRLDFPAACTAFLDELARGLDGRPSSLPMIPTYIETARDLPRGQRVIALDAGGTNLRVALVSFSPEGAPVVENLARHSMPGVDQPIGRDEFFRALASFVLPFVGKADRIGFCFSYPAEILPQKDGRLIQFTKEIKAQGVEGELIGGGLARALSAAGAHGQPRIILVNDTVTTLLAGRNAVPGRRFDSFVGVVCGTGFNVAYVEANSLIRKTPGLDPAGLQVVNTESGSYSRDALGPVDDAFDATTINPGRYRHEKTISGAYLGSLALFAARAAARDGGLGATTGAGSPGSAAAALEPVNALSTRELNDFLLTPDDMRHPLGAACSRMSSASAAAMYRVCDTVVERAAAHVAVNIAAVVLKTGRGLDPRYPVCVTVDGTTFWQLRSFKSRVETFMRRLLSGRRLRAWEITGVDDAPLLGAAIAALTN
jgi:hexokinase